MKLLLQYHEFGLMFANEAFPVFFMAHLYNATRQLRLLDQPWPFMDRIIALHKKALFADAIPTTLTDMNHLLHYRLHKTVNPKENRYKLKEPVATEALRPMLKDDRTDHARALYQIEKLAQHPEQPAAPENNKAPKAFVQKKNHVTPEQYIRTLEKTISSALDELSIDYMRFTKRCIALLEQFRDEWLALEEAHGKVSLRQGIVWEED